MQLKKLQEIIILCIISLVIGSITIESPFIFEGSTTTYNLTKEFTESSVSLDNNTLIFSSRNLTCYEEGVMNLDTWSSTNFNFTPSVPINCTLCGQVSSKTYTVYQGGNVIMSGLIPVDNCINFNVTNTVQTTINTTTSYISFSMFNGTYNYGVNNQLEFYCFPLHNNCTPRYQNQTQWSFNYKR